MVLRAISKRITGHPDGSLKGQMASTGEAKMSLASAIWGVLPQGNAHPSFDALHAGTRKH